MNSVSIADCGCRNAECKMSSLALGSGMGEKEIATSRRRGYGRGKRHKIHKKEFGTQELKKFAPLRRRDEEGIATKSTKGTK